MQQLLAETFRFVVDQTGLWIDGDVAAHQPQLAVTDPRKSLIQRDFAVAQALDFASFEHDAALDRIQHLVLMPRAAIRADRLLVRVVALALVGFSHGTKNPAS